MTNTELRIEQTQKKIDKLNEKLSRINEALNGGKNPYYYEQRDLRITTRDITAAKATLEKLLSKKEKEEKELAERCPVIEEFLENWKQKALAYYKAEHARYKELQAERETMTYEEYQKKIKANISSVTMDCASFGKGWRNRLETIVEREKDGKRTMLMERINKIIGSIVDAKYLEIAENGEINGFVIGDKAKASVTTIGAGGYNIQCFHFRVLVKVFTD